MSDRGLLELAAKAAGIEILYDDCDDFPVTEDGNEWNPLTDDGDALRLAVKCEMLVDFIKAGALFERYKQNNVVAVGGGASHYEPIGQDPYAATRRAIVRAAAEVGRAMK